jgi:hypothetical protein
MSSPPLAVCGLVLLLAEAGHAQVAGVPPETNTQAAYDLNAELAWARGEWPNELDRVALAFPGRRLLSWVPKGQTMKGYIFSEHYDCAPVELSRCESKGCGYLVGQVISEQRIQRGRVEREVYGIALDERISDEHDCATLEWKDRRGQWHEDSVNCGCSGHHPPELVLSFIDNSKAIYAGEPLVIQGVCAGPKEWLPCARGGERLCDTCKAVSLEIEVDGATPVLTIGAEEGVDGLHQHCDEPCPESTNPRIERLRILVEHMRHRGADVTSAGGLPSLWRPSQSSDSVGVYKSKQHCRREHPHAPRR